MSQIKIASFNVNSVKARLPRLLEWLKQSNPDVVLLQELKCVENDFPFEALLDAGFNAVVHGQKTYNGVAILSKFKIEDVVKGFSGSPLLRGSESTRSATMGDSLIDSQARYVEAVISKPSSGDGLATVFRVASIYVPNGGGEILPDETLETSQKFRYKLEFYDHLQAHLAQLAKLDEIQIFGGDFNVAVEEDDIFDPKSFDGQVLFHPLERQKFRRLLNLGLSDSYRAMNRGAGFSWFDYRGGAWQHNKGARIDYLLTSPLATDKIIFADIEDKGVRDQEKASDHCPVVVTLQL